MNSSTVVLSSFQVYFQFISLLYRAAVGMHTPPWRYIRTVYRHLSSGEFHCFHCLLKRRKESPFSTLSETLSETLSKLWPNKWPEFDKVSDKVSDKVQKCKQPFRWDKLYRDLARQ